MISSVLSDISEIKPESVSSMTSNMNAEDLLKSTMKILNEKGYKSNKYSLPSKENIRRKLSIKIEPIRKKDWFGHLPEGFTCRSSHKKYPDNNDEVFFTGSLKSKDSASIDFFKLNMLAKSLFEWATSLPKLVGYYATIRLLGYSDALEAEDILYEELEFDMACSEPVNESDEDQDDEDMDDEDSKGCIYEVEGIKYIHENEEINLTQSIENTISIKDCFSSVELFKHSFM